MSHSGATSNKYSIKKFLCIKLERMCVLYLTFLENLEKDNIGYCSVSLLMLI